MKSRHLAAVIVSAIISLPAAQALSAMPDGASSINETYQDWRVTCVTNDVGARCAMVFNQVAKDTGQRVLTVELSLPPGVDTVQGAIIAPFGLALAQGARVTVDEESEGKLFGFSTCLPQGCLVPLEFDATMLESLKGGNVMNITVQPIDGTNMVRFPVSLKGFTAAYKRLSELR
ncbi:invasion associated locus B family protein [Martelella limonii]|uniref:invasion associated locus B family protein n=1 Tax=Martelella limonii TaxID=1647649 RepID=UPI001580E1F5